MVVKRRLWEVFRVGRLVMVKKVGVSLRFFGEKRKKWGNFEGICVL